MPEANIDLSYFLYEDEFKNHLNQKYIEVSNNAYNNPLNKDSEVVLIDSKFNFGTSLENNIGTNYSKPNNMNCFWKYIYQIKKSTPGSKVKLSDSEFQNVLKFYNITDIETKYKLLNIVNKFDQYSANKLLTNGTYQKKNNITDDEYSGRHLNSEIEIINFQKYFNKVKKDLVGFVSVHTNNVFTNNVFPTKKVYDTRLKIFDNLFDLSNNNSLAKWAFVEKQTESEKMNNNGYTNNFKSAILDGQIIYTNKYEMSNTIINSLDKLTTFILSL